MRKWITTSLCIGLLLTTGLANTVAAPIYSDGDLAPQGNPDGLITLADYLIANGVVSGAINADDQTLSHGDIYPLAAPDGVINISDLLMLQQWLFQGDRQYVATLDLFSEGPATITGETDNATSSTTLVVGNYTGPGATLTNDPNFADPIDVTNTVWSVAVSGGTANVSITTSNLINDPVFNSGFNLIGDGLGQLVFDIKLNSLSTTAVLTVKMDSGFPDVGQVVLDTTGLSLGVWHRIAINFSELLADPGFGNGLDLRNIVSAFVIEVTNGDAAFYLDNIFINRSCSGADSCQAGVKTQPIYSLVWSDEFDGNSLETENWSIETGYGNFGWGNDEWQLYTSSANNISVADGNLVISAQCLLPSQFCSKRDGSITSGKVNSLNKFEFKYGKVQARLKPPVGKGAWPAFWLLGANFPEVGWPRTGEIDVMEMNNRYSNNRTTHFTLHWCDDARSSNPCNYDPGWVYDSQTLTLSESLGDDFHIFEAEWTQQGIIGRIDGIPYFYKAINPSTMAEFLEEFYMILNVAIGGTLGGAPDNTTPWPQTMLVDYVRVYQIEGGGGSFTVGDPPEPVTETRGIYSETHNESVVAYSQIINAADFSGNNTWTDEQSTAVTAFDGSVVLAANYTNSGRNYGGFVFNFGSGQDISAYQTLNFAIDTSAMSGFADLVLQIENPSGGQPAPKVSLSSYTPEMSDNWALYEIPLSDFLGQAVGLDLSNVVYLGFWNAQLANGQLGFGTLYFDDIHLGGGQ
jgi:beta-glucanase (GH16 family)